MPISLTTTSREGEPFGAEIVAQYGRARDMVIQRLRSLPRVRMPMPEAAFYAVLPGRRHPRQPRARAPDRERGGVGLAPGIAFGSEGEGWLRLCFAASLPKLGDALDRLAKQLA